MVDANLTNIKRPYPKLVFARLAKFLFLFMMSAWFSTDYASGITFPRCSILNSAKMAACIATTDEPSYDFYIEYGDELNIFSYLKKPCTSYSTDSCISSYPGTLRNLTTNTSFPTRNTTSPPILPGWTIYAGVAENQRVPLPIGINVVDVVIDGLYSPTYTFNVRPKRTISGIGTFDQSNNLQSTFAANEDFVLATATRGFRANGVSKITLVDQSNNIEQPIHTQSWVDDRSDLEMAFNIKILIPGKYQIKYSYTSDDGKNTNSNETRLITIAPAVALNTLSIISDGPNHLGKSIVLTSEIQTSIGPATGTVEFFDDNVSIGSAEVINNKASLRTTIIKRAGTHQIRSQYSGDKSYQTSASNVVDLALARNPTYLTIRSSGNVPYATTPPTLQATVSGYKPQGEVAFYDGSTLIGKRSLVATSDDTSVASMEGMLTAGEHTITFTYEGDDINANGSSNGVLVSIAKGDPLNQLEVANQAPYPVGAAITITAKMNQTISSPTGKVSFFDGDLLLGTVDIAAYKAVLTTTKLKRIGKHSLRSTYVGDTNFESKASSVVEVEIVPAKSNLSLTSSEPVSSYGKPITLSLKIDGAEPSGQVSFYNGTHLLGTSSINAGVASLSIANLAVGEHKLTASYDGDEFNLASTSNAVTQTIAKADTVNTLSTSNQAPYSPNSRLSFIAELSGSGEGRTGTVNFYDGDAFLGSASVHDNKATINDVRLNTVGVRRIRAEYSGDATYQLATSNDLSLNVEVINSASTLSSSANPALTQNTVTFTVQVTGDAPTGKVDFYADGQLLGSSDVLNGSASFATKFSKMGSMLITANYSGDAGNKASASEPLTQVVKFNAALLTPILQLLLNPRNGD